MKDEASCTCDSCGEEIVVHPDLAPEIQWPFAKYGMQSFHHFTEGKDSSNKIKAMTDLVDAMRAVLDHFDIATRRFVWRRLMTAKGHELVERLLRTPRTYLSTSELRKLAEGH
jgi:hypothetical protein